MKTKTKTLIKALRILANDIESDDGVANACVAEAADRLEELENKIDDLEIKLMRDTYRLRGS
jgi:uncharacterized protein Yka (UPF0111/DUF47 family)